MRARHSEQSPEERAVSRGWLALVLAPWLILMMLTWPPILVLGVEKGFQTDNGLRVVGGSLFAGFVLAWAWWAEAAPRWRLWAYKQASDIRKLEELAVAAKMIWPVNHPLTRTEFRFGLRGAQLRALEAALRG